MIMHVPHGGCRQVVKTQDCDSCMRGFKSHYPPLNLIMRSIGVSPSGKAMDSDSIMRRFESCYPSQKRDAEFPHPDIYGDIAKG